MSSMIRVSARKIGKFELEITIIDIHPDSHNTDALISREYESNFRDLKSFLLGCLMILADEGKVPDFVNAYKRASHEFEGNLDDYKEDDGRYIEPTAINEPEIVTTFVKSAKLLSTSGTKYWEGDYEARLDKIDYSQLPTSKTKIILQDERLIDKFDMKECDSAWNIHC